MYPHVLCNASRPRRPPVVRRARRTFENTMVSAARSTRRTRGLRTVERHDGTWLKNVQLSGKPWHFATGVSSNAQGYSRERTVKVNFVFVAGKSESRQVPYSNSAEYQAIVSGNYGESDFCKMSEQWRRGLFSALWHLLRKSQKHLSVALTHFGQQLA